ncbi:hypothetical protein ISR94_01285 [Candidatus Microgenomates bacterium]|nr:hypothetical protein [Candidatus Microgenomates bacterium]
MKKLIWFTTTFILFVIFVFPALMASTINMTPSGVQPGYKYDIRLSIYKERDIKQEFVSREKNLTAVATSIRNPNLKNKKEIILNLYDENNTLLRTSLLSGKNIEDGDFVKFVFEPINDSADVKYNFTLSSPDSGLGETIEVFIIEPTGEVLNYTYGEETKEGGVPLVTFHKPSTKWEIVKRVYSNLFSRLL